MRFQKNKPSHIVFLLISLINSVIFAQLRRIKLIKRKKIVLFYGHVLNGNLLSLYNYLKKTNVFEPYYVTMFPEYATKLKREGVNVLCTVFPSNSYKISSANAFITDHGSHFLFNIYKKTDIGFFDVWHGVPYKGFDETSFNEQKFYNEVWVSSKEFVKIYKKRYAFNNEIVATGYGRTDPLVNKEYTRDMLLKKYPEIPVNKYLILVAPTWKQDSNNRSIIPFNEKIDNFFKKLNEIGKNNDATIIFRAHLNSGDTVKVEKYKNLIVMPYARYTNAEEFLGGVDLLVTDWSSIAFDYLVLKKPVVYLDVEAPFDKGFTLDGSYRFGPVVSSMEELSKEISKYLGKDKKYQTDFKEVIGRSWRVAYGELADGKVSERQLKRLKMYIDAQK